MTYGRREPTSDTHPSRTFCNLWAAYPFPSGRDGGTFVNSRLRPQRVSPTAHPHHSGAHDSTQHSTRRSHRPASLLAAAESGKIDPGHSWETERSRHANTRDAARRPRLS